MIARALLLGTTLIAASVARADPPCAALVAETRDADAVEERLSRDGVAIAERKRAVAAEIAAFNAGCGDSPSSDCQARRGELAGHQREVDAAIEHFRDARRTLETQRARLAERAAQCATPKVDPCAMFDDAARRSAQETLDAQSALRQKLVARLADLAKWRAQAGRDTLEFEQMRTVSACEELSDLLSAIPMQRVLTSAARAPRLAAQLSEARIARIMTGYHSVQALLAGASTVETEAWPKQRKEALATVHHAREALLAIAIAQLPGDARGLAARHVLEGTGRAFDVAAHLVGYLSDPAPRKGSFAERWQPEGKLIVAVGAVIEWPIALALGAEEIAYAETRRALGKRAVEQLAGVAAANWNAEVYLRTKLERIDANAVELTQIAHCKN